MQSHLSRAREDALYVPSFGQRLSETEVAAGEQAMKAIRPEAIRAHMRFLSNSLLDGRGTGTRGYEIAAHYVATELDSMGLQPMGVNHTWFQPVPLRKIEVVPERSSLALVDHQKETRLLDGEDYVILGSPVDEDVSVEAPVVFVGFGVTAAEFQYDDYAGIDVHGKIVAWLFGAPARFPSTQRAYFSDRWVKARNAVAHGAAGMITLMLPEDQKRLPWTWLVPQFKAASMRWLDDKGMPNDSFPELRGVGLFSQKGAELLFRGAPKSLDDTFAAARSSQSQPFALQIKAKIHTVTRLTRIESPNIIAALYGSDPKLRDQYVVYTAHVDHLGLCTPIEGDNVCHGAWDNASGTS
jgi:Peptidase family M28/PA domain